jgi:hypothetical protein
MEYDDLQIDKGFSHLLWLKLLITSMIVVYSVLITFENPIETSGISLEQERHHICAHMYCNPQAWRTDTLVAKN